LIIVAGRASDFSTAENFTTQLSAATIRLACDSSRDDASPGACNPHGSVSLDWQGQRISFFPSNGDGLPGNKFCRPPHCEVRLPEIDGMVVDVTPGKVYDGPHLSSEVGSNRVTTKYDDDYSVVYDFSTDTITSNPKTNDA
jgi:hypothetical protein